MQQAEEAPLFNVNIVLTAAESGRPQDRVYIAGKPYVFLFDTGATASFIQIIISGKQFQNRSEVPESPLKELWIMMESGKNPIIDFDDEYFPIQRVVPEARLGSSDDSVDVRTVPEVREDGMLTWSISTATRNSVRQDAVSSPSTAAVVAGRPTLEDTNIPGRNGGGLFERDALHATLPPRTVLTIAPTDIPFAEQFGLS